MLKPMDMQEFWNERYNQKEMIYGAEPNEFFRQQLEQLSPGSMLLPAEGEGRNAVYAAQQGWQVQAFDYSAVGREKALQLAAQQQVRIDYQLTDAEHYKSAPAQFDAVALIYAHFPPALRQRLHGQVTQWLKPGGVLVLEAFHPRQLAYTSGGPKAETMLYTAGMLQGDFMQLRIELLQEQEVRLNEGPYHKGAGYVTRLVARRPSTS